MNITEDYVSFEVAKLLKEKGFDSPCFMAYYETNNGHEIDHDVGRNNYQWDIINKEDGLSNCCAPTLQMAMKWLREVHNIFIDICTLSPLTYIYRVCLISDTTGYFYEDYACEEGERFMSYKEAVEFALDYCLNNILEV